MRWLKRIFKFAGFLAGFVVLLLLLLIVVIRVPAVQQELAGKATDFLERKTGGSFSIGSIYINWPLRLQLKEFLVREPDQDTLLYVGRLESTVSLPKLLKGTISIGATELENSVIQISRSRRDSLFNFDFIIRAFADTVQEDTSTSSTKIEFSEFHLSNIRITMDDEVSGNLSKIHLGDLVVDAKETSLEEMKFSLDEISLENSTASILLRNTSVIVDTAEFVADTSTQLPVIDFDELNLKNVSLAFANAADSSSMAGRIGEFQITDAGLNPNINEFIIDKLVLQNSNLALYNGSYKSVLQDTTFSDSLVLPEFPHAKASMISLVNVNVSRKSVLNDGIQQAHFSANNFQILDLNAEITKVESTGNSANARIQSLSLREGNAFHLMKFSTDLAFDQRQFSLSQLELITAHSSIHADLQADYESLDALIQQQGNTNLNLQLEVPKIGFEDVDYLVPGLAIQPAVRNAGITLSIDVNGKLNDIDIERFLVTTDQGSRVRVQGRIQGLPEVKQLSYSLPQLQVFLTKGDLRRFIPAKSWPESINVPAFVKVNGKVKGDPSKADSKLIFATDAGKIASVAEMKFSRDTSYNVQLLTSAFQLEKLLGDSAGLGETAFNFKVKGHGLNPDRLVASAEMDLHHIDYRKYRYQNARLAAEYLAKEITLYTAIDDSALAFELKAAASIRKEEEYLLMDAFLRGADLQRMNITQEDMRISARLQTDLTGTNADNLNGSAGLTKFIISKNENTYVLDSVLLATVNKEGKSSLKFTSAVFNVDFDGNVRPGEVVKAIQHQLNHYYPFFPPAQEGIPQHFTLKLDFRSHPVLSEVFFKGLTDFHPGSLSLEFDNRAEKFICKVDIPRVRYNDQRLEKAKLEINSAERKLQYALSIDEAASGNYGVQNLVAEGTIADNKGNLHLHEGDDKEKKKDTLSSTLDVQVNFTGESRSKHTISIESPFRLGTQVWNIPDDNRIVLQPGETQFKNVVLTSVDQELIVANTAKGLRITADHFNLAAVSGIISRDTLPVTGTLDGEIELGKSPSGNSNFEAAASISQLSVRAVPVGDIKLDASNVADNTIQFNFALSGNGNDLKLRGNATPMDSATTLSGNGDINAINASILDGLSFGALKETNGQLTGSFTVEGTTINPILDGKLRFNNFSTTPQATGVTIVINDEVIAFTKDALTFDSFRIDDTRKGRLNLNGKITLKDFTPDVLDLDLRAQNFTVFDVARKKDQLYYGALKTDGVIKVNGFATLPEVDATLTIRDGSDFAVVVPQEELSTDKGQEVIEFRDSIDMHPILLRGETDHAANRFRGVNLDARLRIDEKARFRLLIDPATGDSLSVSGTSTLAFTMDPSGDITLTGIYNLKEGSYFTSMQDIMQKRFLIREGSTIRWNGEPLDAELDIDAFYKLKTSPAELITGQISGLSDAEQSQYKQRLEFEVNMYLNGNLLQPEISFNIELAEKDRGAMGGLVDSRLQQVNSDPSELNKQVFALLLLNRFVQQDPLATASGSSGAEGIARSSVSRFLSDQLTQLAGNHIMGAELSFDIDSYEDYSQGSPQGRTEVGVALKKQFMDDRVSVSVGGGFDVEGEAAKNNQLSDLTGDVIVEYKLTPDGRLRASGFRKNEFQDAIEGQVTETGVGLVYMREFNKWKNFFRRTQNRRSDEQTDK